MTTSIFIRSFSGDFDWLPWCLKSIAKYCSGFSEIVIVAPEKDALILKSWNLTKEKVIPVHQIMSGYMAQQSDKMHADIFCSSDFIMHVDSDCIFNQPVTPATFFRDGKPIQLFTPYYAFKPGEVPWQPITTKALGFVPANEHMRRLPIIYPRGIYEPVRNHISQKHGVPLSTYIKSQPDKHFSEFNCLGAYSFAHLHDLFYWQNTLEELQPPVLEQFWSWGRVTLDNVERMKQLLGQA